MATLLTRLQVYFTSFLSAVLGIYYALKHRDTGPLGVDRKTGIVRRQHEPFSRRLGQWALYNPVMELIDSRGIIRYYLATETIHEGHTHMSPKSKSQIRPFVEFYHIDMTEFVKENPDDYDTFNDYFTREIKPGKRTIAYKDDPTVAIISADCRLTVWNSVEEARKFWIKGRNFTIETLIKDSQIASKFHHGDIVSLRLSPEDYHRYHSPVGGRVTWLKTIGGTYYGVDPYEIRSRLDILTQNARTACIIKSDIWGEVLFVAIGAKDVGSVKFHTYMKEGHMIKKGDEIGLFQYGGSSIIVAFEPHRITFDEDLRKWSKRQIEVHSKWGESLGRATVTSIRPVSAGNVGETSVTGESGLRKTFHMEE